MKLAINIALSLVMLGLCVWLVWPDADAQEKLKDAFERIQLADWPYFAGFIGLLAVTHFFRAWRWNNLLAPIDAKLPPGRLMAVSSVSFMFILALPARLGEFVRPALIRDKGKVSGSAVLGTVAVERIVDGLLVSVFLFASFFANRHSEHVAWWMMPTAYSSLGLFTAAMLFLGFALKWPDGTVKFAIRMTGARYYAPRLAQLLSAKVRSVIDGFVALKDRRNLAVFVLWTIIYWTANGLSFYVLALAFHLDIPVIAAFAVTALVAVGISLPNAPALAGQYHLLATAGLSLYVGEQVADGDGLAFAIMLWGLQVVWYIGVGALALATPYVSLHEVWRSRKSSETGDDAPASPESAG